MNSIFFKREKPRRPLLKSHPTFLILFISILMVAFPALACNLPSRQQPEELIFPTGQAPSSSSQSTPFPSGEGTASAPSPATPTSTSGSTQSPQSTYTFPGLATATPGAAQATEWQLPEPGSELPPFTYWTQAGDTLSALVARFGVNPDQVSPPQPASGLLNPGQALTIPNGLGEPPYPSVAMPDSLVIYSPEASGFSIEEYIAQAGGYLSTYQEEVNKEKGEWLNGAQIVRRVAENTSVNPKILLAFLEFRSGWVRGPLKDPAQQVYPIGFYVPEYKGLYLELSLVAKELNIGFYGWRGGTLTNLTFGDGSKVRISPALNAGSVGVQNLTSRFYRQQRDWLDSLYGEHGFLVVYRDMFGDPWQAATRYEPLYWADLKQPALELPFTQGESWSLTAGPHVAWNTGTPLGALDFSPIILLPPCAPSPAWVTASAPGLVVRIGDGIVAVDLDGDGSEQSGWVIIYMHIAEQDRVPLGTWVDTNTPLGHPSCEGGTATGTNLHIARKYNGEWIAADGPIPLVLSGWTAHNGERAYYGTLEKDGQTVSAHPDGSSGSTITR